VCLTCSQPIPPHQSYVNHYENYYCLQHFTCVVCGKHFTNSSVYTDEIEKKPYCYEDYVNTFAPQCEKSGERVVGRVIRAMGGKTFHPRNFSCKKCLTDLAAKGSYGLFEGEPYCPLHTPMTKEELALDAQRTRQQVRKRYQNLLLQIESAVPDPALSQISFNSNDPMCTMEEIVGALSQLEEISDEDEHEVKRKSLQKGVQEAGGGEWGLVKNLFGFLADSSIGSSESKSAGVQTLWKLGELEPQLFRLCGQHDALSLFLLPMINSKNSEALFLAATFLGKMCGIDGALSSQQLAQVFNEDFIDSMLGYILQYDVEDDGEPENVQSLMVSRSVIGALIGIHYQFSDHKNDIVLQRILAHELCTTIASRILTRFNFGLGEPDLRAMARFFEGGFAIETGRLFFSADLKVVMEICIRFLKDPSDKPIDSVRRAYLDLVDLLFSAGEGGEGEDLQQALEGLTESSIADPLLGERGRELLVRIGGS